MNNIIKIKEKLKKLREETGLNQEQFANKSKISLASVKKYESKNDNRLPETFNLMQYANFCNVSYDYLLDENINNKNYENVYIEKILKLSDNSIENLKNNSHHAFDLLLGSEYFVAINELLEFYLEIGNIVTKINNINLENINILATQLDDIIKTYNSIYETNSKISVYINQIQDIDEVYLDVLSNNTSDYSSNNELKKALEEESLIVSTIFLNAQKILKLELIEELSNFLKNSHY